MSDKKPKPASPEPEPRTAGNELVQAVGKALQRKKAGAGWPEPPGRYANKKTRQKANAK